jgi:manganese transport protein
MDPGNWSTDLSAGAGFRYGLLWIVGLASLMAIFLQVVAARLGVVTGKDLAQCCRDHLPGWTRWPNYLSCELAIAACDLAEVLGSAVAIHLLFPRISLLFAVIITAFDVVVLLSLQRFGMRWIEAVLFCGDIRDPAGDAECAGAGVGGGVAEFEEFFPEQGHGVYRGGDHRCDRDAA